MTTEVLSTPEIGAVEVERPALSPERRILAKAKELVSAGWNANGSRNGGRRCVIQATGDAARLLGLPLSMSHEADRLLERALGIDKRRHPRGVCALPDWNDAPERTHAEVVALFDKALLA